MSDATAEAADLLLAARRDPASKLTALPASLKPADQAAAYAIQHRVAARFAAIGGWKVGAPGPEAPAICGPMPGAGVVPSPATLSSALHTLRGIEAEICFRMAADLPLRATPYTRHEVIAAIAAAHPAIEVLESRFTDPDALEPAHQPRRHAIPWRVRLWRGSDRLAGHRFRPRDGQAVCRRVLADEPHRQSGGRHDPPRGLAGQRGGHLGRAG